MAKVSVIVDDGGKLWGGNSFQLRQELDGFVAGEGFPDYVVKNLGFVHIERHGASASVWLRPAIVAPAALARMVCWISDERIERILLNQLVEGVWQHTLVGASETLCESVAGMISSAAPDAGSKDTVIAQSIGTGTLEAGSPLARALDIWRETDGDLREIARRPDFVSSVGDRYSLFERCGDWDFVLRGHGIGLPPWAKAWLNSAIGSPIHDHPDHPYGLSCMASYRQVMSGGQPELQHVDAYVSWPGARRQRRRYKRLLLPLSCAGRTDYLLSATAEDGGIDLRSAG